MISAEFQINEDIDKLFGTIDMFLQNTALKKALHDGAPPLKARMSDNAPDSTKPQRKYPFGTRAKWSELYKKDTRWQDVRSGQHMGIKTFNGRVAAGLVVGGLTKFAKKLNFNRPKSKQRRHVFWGGLNNQQTGTYFRDDRWIIQSWDESKAAVVDGFNRSLKQQVESQKFG